MTPDQLKVIFDSNAFILMFAWGLVCKYVPALAKIPNNSIPWINAIAYILAKLVLPSSAHAGGLSADQGNALLGVGGIILGSFTNSIWARQFYEGFARPLIESLFHWKKAVA
jgi:hypothetical protein